MKLVRGHGLGNDYLVLAQGQGLNALLVRSICDRHTGVGSDGILEPTAPIGADYGVRVWNPDGSIAEVSGNGMRIYARWLRDNGAPKSFSVSTGFGDFGCEVSEGMVAVQMGQATFDRDTEEQLALSGRTVLGTAVSVPNPHFVGFYDDPDALPWRSLGSEIESHERFGNRTNVQFARVIDRSSIDIRIWERGAGETSASGSSSCGAAASAVRTDRIDAGWVTVHMPGGVLRVHVAPDFALTLEGPVEMVCAIELDEHWLKRRLVRSANQ